MKFSDVWKAIFAAMKGPLGAAWGQARVFAEGEAKKLAHSLQTIVKLYALPAGDPGKITKEQARLLLDIQVSASRGILLTIATLGLIAVQKALEAGLSAVRDAVNGAIGFALI